MDPARATTHRTCARAAVRCRRRRVAPGRGGRERALLVDDAARAREPPHVQEHHAWVPLPTRGSGSIMPLGSPVDATRGQGPRTGGRRGSRRRPRRRRNGVAAHEGEVPPGFVAAAGAQARGAHRAAARPVRRAPPSCVWGAGMSASAHAGAASIIACHSPRSFGGRGAGRGTPGDADHQCALALAVTCPSDPGCCWHQQYNQDSKDSLENDGETTHEPIRLRHGHLPGFAVASSMVKRLTCHVASDMSARRTVRLRREYLYRKSLEGDARTEYERKMRVRTALAEGKPGVCWRWRAARAGRVGWLRRHSLPSSPQCPPSCGARRRGSCPPFARR
jgi:hypothetical protein